MPAIEADLQGREAGPIDSCSAGISVGTDADLTPDPRPSSSPCSSHEVRDLALHLRPNTV